RGGGRARQFRLPVPVRRAAVREDRDRGGQDVRCRRSRLHAAGRAPARRVRAERVRRAAGLHRQDAPVAVARPHAQGRADRLADGAPAPAGGSAAALVLAQAAALCAKCARLSARQLTAERAAALTDEAEQILATAASLIDQDPLAYGAVIEALRRRADGLADG